LKTLDRHRLTLVALVAAIGFAIWWGYDYWREHRFDKVIAAAARHYQLDPALIKALIWRESRFNPTARGRAGEMGLMQIREVAAMEGGFDPAYCFDPSTNIMAGSCYLKKALGRYQRTDNPPLYALIDYNAGRGNVLKWQTGAGLTNGQVFLIQVQFPSSRTYALAILQRAERYHRRGEFKS
jgi:soluble lytic murein transglycosylase